MTTIEDEGRRTVTLKPSGALAPWKDTRTDDATVRPPVDVALRAMRLEALLGDPEDPANPYGRTALASTAGAEIAAPDDVLAEIVPRADDLRGAGADRFVRVLRPLLRRDLGLGHAWAIRPMLAARAASDQAGGIAGLLGPAALIAATGDVLHTAARIVDGLASHTPSARQWRPTLAAAFADLLACECLTAVALRCARPAGEGESVPVAAVGYLVPHLVGGLLADLELVLNESGFGPETTERKTLAALEAHRAAAGVDWTAAALRQAELVRALPELDGFARRVRGQGEDEQAAAARLFTLSLPAPDGDGACLDALAGALPGGAASLAAADGGNAATGALARTARRLATEQRAVGRACRAATPADPADPAARALADRFALVLLAAAALGVARAVSDTGAGFLGGPDWVLLALERAGQRLGVPLPGHETDPRAAVWEELAERTRQGVDCDVYATQLFW
ncbi:hypothetical protein [Streptomyces sp. NBC_01465]|uniref:hypothetical protein n=1 Tax=Streptomyces sp. NBC_01465 TaxID=2903878 RepID=UPI002E2EBC4B|nr:hypothetical protein [Streptomyces sp. NBC_01465]